MNPSANQPQTCWEFWNCDKDTRENCHAFKLNSGKACWYFKHDFSPFVKRDFEYCWECPWYKRVISSAS